MLILSTYRIILHPTHLQKVFSLIIFIKERYSFLRHRSAHESRPSAQARVFSPPERPREPAPTEHPRESVAPLVLSSLALPERPRDAALPEYPRKSALPERPQSQRFQSAPRSWSRPAHICLRWSRPAHLCLRWSRPAHRRLRWHCPVQSFESAPQRLWTSQRKCWGGGGGIPTMAHGGP